MDEAVCVGVWVTSEILIRYSVHSSSWKRRNPGGKCLGFELWAMKSCSFQSSPPGPPSKFVPKDSDFYDSDHAPHHMFRLERVKV